MNLIDAALLCLSANQLLGRIAPLPHPAPLPIPAGERITATHIKAMWDRPWIQPDTPPELLGCVAGWISEDGA